MALKRHTHADDGRLDGGELAGEARNVFRWNAGHALNVVRRELGRSFGKLGETRCVLLDPRLVDMAAPDQSGDDPHGERAVGAWLRHDVPISLLRCARAIAIDHHHLGAAFLRLQHEGPVMQIGGDRVAGPDHDVARMHEALRIDAAGRADGEQPCGG
jgi:hypothetical protein